MKINEDLEHFQDLFSSAADKRDSKINSLNDHWPEQIHRLEIQLSDAHRDHEDAKARYRRASDAGKTQGAFLPSGRGIASQTEM